MIKVIKSFGQNIYVFDNLKNKNHIVDIDINDEKIKVDFDLLIQTQFSGGNISDKNYFEKIKNFLNLGKYSKAPCGGFVNFFKIEDKKCREYIIYSGVNEVSHSHYIVTIHKILTM